jgi:hypothetical protein
MASSVYSESAFSSAGITLTKRRNRLKGDVVEALQVLKAEYRQEGDIFKEQPSMKMENCLEEQGDMEDELMKQVEDEFEGLEFDSDCEES